MKTLLFFIFSSVLVFLATLFFRLGGHKPVDVVRAERPELHILFKDHQGPYHSINDVILSVEAWASQHNLSCTQTFGEYFDDPRQVDERQLRSRGGCILNRQLSQELMESLKTSPGLNATSIPARHYITAAFHGAPSIGPFKVYPKVEDYFENEGLVRDGAVIEIYTILSKNEAQTEYLFPFKQK